MSPVLKVFLTKVQPTEDTQLGCSDYSDSPMIFPVAATSTTFASCDLPMGFHGHGIYVYIYIIYILYILYIYIYLYIIYIYIWNVNSFLKSFHICFHMFSLWTGTLWARSCSLALSQTFASETPDVFVKGALLQHFLKFRRYFDHPLRWRPWKLTRTSVRPLVATAWSTMDFLTTSHYNQ